MNTRLLTTLLICLCLSCESNPDIMNDDVPETLFIWGYVDQNSGIHRVRVRRAILEEGDVRNLVQDPTSTAPKDPIEVRLVSSTDLTSTYPRIMEPVTLPKQDGVFSTEENIVYEASWPIYGGQSLRVEVENLRTGEITSATAGGIQAPDFLFPRTRDGWYQENYLFTNPDEPFHIKFLKSPNLIQKFIMEVKYVDFITDDFFVCRKASFSGGDIFFEDDPLLRKEIIYTKEFTLEYLFNIFNNIIPDDPQVKYRKFYRFNFKSLAGSSSLRKYKLLAEKFDDNRKLVFSNVQNGYGLFYATHYTETGNIKPSHSFFELIAKDERISDLKFVKYEFRGEYEDPDGITQNPLMK